MVGEMGKTRFSQRSYANADGYNASIHDADASFKADPYGSSSSLDWQ
jgi:hypothetical protein